MAVVGSGVTIVRRCLSLPGGVFEQDGEDSAQPVPGVGRRVDIDPDHPQLRGFPGGPPLFCFVSWLLSKSMLSSQSPTLDPADAGLTRKANAGAAPSVASG